MPRRFGWLLAGLSLVMFATLVLEILDTRLLSVLTWYHLSFLAVSLAMLGMAAGAVRVFVGDERFSGTRVAETLPRYCGALAVAIPGSHLASLCIPIPLLRDFSVMEVTAVAVATAVLAVPFILSGVVVTLALTRTGGPVGRLYASDLFGAAAGCLGVIVLLTWSDITTVAFAAGSAAALGAWCFHRYGASPRIGLSYLSLAAALGTIAIANASTDQGFGVVYPKNRSLWLAAQKVDLSAWNTHSFVIVQKPETSQAFMWGGGLGAERFQSNIAWITIDGEAGTPITQWDGKRESLEWVQYDVTSLPYHLRRGDAAVIGVGGGRDLLSALWGGSAVTGIEVNGILVDALQSRYADFAGLAGRPDVTLAHDEARSFLSRRHQAYDILQMSLIDTWASTGAGAFTLSENGLYTREAWQVFLNALRPGGVFSVSRWFSPNEVSETTRMLSLGVAALLDRGVAQPFNHMIMLSRGRVATLLLSPAPFTTDDASVVRVVADRFGFSVLVAPWQPAADAKLRRILVARTDDDLDAATTDATFDFSPPSDARPFFFNMLRPRAFFRVYDVPRGGVLWGNLRATVTLVVLFVVAGLLVAAIVAWPLWRSGRPGPALGPFRWAALYFALIGSGFMLIQIPFLQRFSVFLGHPTYSLAILLFTMILSAGFGSFLSDRIRLEDRVVRWIPVAIAVMVLLELSLLGFLLQAATPMGLPMRSLVVVACVAPLSVLLGFCFPFGMRLVGRSSDLVTAWMWGINGATGVMASIAAVGLSIWVGTQASLAIAAVMYALLPVVMKKLS